MSRCAFWIIGVLALTASCGVEPSTSEVLEAASCKNCPPPPPPRCETDAQGVETGRCVVDDAAHGTCAIGIRGVQGCSAGRQGTVSQGGCGFHFDQNTCSATGWVL